MLRNILKRRILFAILMASMLSGVAFLTFTYQRASAKGCWWRTTTYYSDATYSTIIGQYIIPCEGMVQIWGSTSAFVQKDTGECGC